MKIETKTAILYVRVRPSNKKYVERGAKEAKVSDSCFVDELLSRVKRNASNAKKSKRRT